MELRIEAVKRLTVAQLNEMRFNERSEMCNLDELKPKDRFYYDKNYYVCTRVTKKRVYCKRIDITQALPFIKTDFWEIVHPISKQLERIKMFSYYYLDADLGLDEQKDCIIEITDDLIHKTNNHCVVILEYLKIGSQIYSE